LTYHYEKYGRTAFADADLFAAGAVCGLSAGCGATDRSARAAMLSRASGGSQVVAKNQNVLHGNSEGSV